MFALAHTRQCGAKKRPARARIDGAAFLPLYNPAHAPSLLPLPCRTGPTGLPQASPTGPVSSDPRPPPASRHHHRNDTCPSAAQPRSRSPYWRPCSRRARRRPPARPARPAAAGPADAASDGDGQRQSRRRGPSSQTAVAEATATATACGGGGGGLWWWRRGRVCAQPRAASHARNGRAAPPGLQALARTRIFQFRVHGASSARAAAFKFETGPVAACDFVERDTDYGAMAPTHSQNPPCTHTPAQRNLPAPTTTRRKRT